VAALVLGAVGLATGALRAGFTPRDWGVVVLLGFFGNTLFHSLLVLGVHRTSPGHAALLVGLGAWSFLMASAHGAGFMVLPWVMPMPGIQ
jgi:drug/metabolite transporter (DMT)-like permease